MQLCLSAGLGSLCCVKVMCLSQEGGVQAGGVLSSRLKSGIGIYCTSQAV